MKYIALSCLLACSLFTTMAQTRKSTLTMLLKRIEQVYNIKISYSPTQTDFITPPNQYVDSQSNLNETLALVLDGTDFIWKRNNEILYLKREIKPATHTRNSLDAATGNERDNRPVQSLVTPYTEVKTDRIIADPDHIYGLTGWVTEQVIPVSSRWNMSSNLLLLMTGSPNLAFDYSLTPKWSIGASLSYNPWSYADMRIRHFVLRPDVRYWFCQFNNGHFLSGGIRYMRYNIGNFPDWGIFPKDIKETRYQGNSIGAGVSYGYSWIISKHFNLEVELGVGLLYNSYDKYPCAECGSASLSQKRNIRIVPDQFAVNLVYILK